MSRIAVVDTGTNSTRLLVAETGGAGVREILRHTAITRLGEGVDKTGRLAPPARERVIACVAGYAATIGELSVKRALIIATSSVRDAADGDRFMASLAREFGMDYKLLAGEEEAQLTFSGAAIGLGEDVRAMLFDVGGGSTEIVLGSRRRIDFAASMDLGCVRIKERFFASDPATTGQREAASAFIDTELARTVDFSRVPEWEETLAVAGTVTALAALDLGLESYDREQVQGHVMTRETIDSLLAALARMTVAERTSLPTMEAGRADVIVAGSVIVSRLMHHARISSFTVSEYDILDGAALAMAEGRL